jgi:hypothetical protein
MGICFKIKRSDLIPDGVKQSSIVGNDIKQYENPTRMSVNLRTNLTARPKPVSKPNELPLMGGGSANITKNYWDQSHKKKGNG